MMPLKPFERLTRPRKSKARTTGMRKATSAAAVRETRLRNLEKARRAKKKKAKLAKKGK